MGATGPVPGSHPAEWVRVERQSEAVIVALSGDVDYATAPNIKEAMLCVLAQRPELLVIDCRP